MELIEKELSNRVIRVFYDVYNTLGYGFLEKVYQNAMFIELRANGMEVTPQKQIFVYYKGTKVGEYYADLVVEKRLILELKASEVFVEENEWQLLNYLRSTDMEVGLLLNFGKKPVFKRKVFQNSNKASLNKNS